MTDATPLRIEVEAERPRSAFPDRGRSGSRGARRRSWRTLPRSRRVAKLAMSFVLLGRGDPAPRSSIGGAGIPARGLAGKSACPPFRPTERGHSYPRAPDQRQARVPGPAPRPVFGSRAQHASFSRRSPGMSRDWSGSNCSVRSAQLKELVEDLVQIPTRCVLRPPPQERDRAMLHDLVAVDLDDLDRAGSQPVQIGGGERTE